MFADCPWVAQHDDDAALLAAAGTHVREAHGAADTGLGDVDLEKLRFLIQPI
jgi:hypothetical protein